MKRNVIPQKDEKCDEIYFYDRNAKKLLSDNFKFINGNRETNPSKVKSLQTAFENGDVHIPPIQVDQNTGYIIDGQHRYKAIQNAWSRGYNPTLRVVYEKFKDNTERQHTLVILNNSQLKWRDKNYIDNAQANGNKDIDTLRKFQQTHSLCQKKLKGGKIKYNDRYAYMLLYGRNALEDIKKFKPTTPLTPEMVDFADQIHGEIMTFMTRLGYESNNFVAPMIIAWRTIRTHTTENRIVNAVGINRMAEIIKQLMSGVAPFSRIGEWSEMYHKAIDYACEELNNEK